jgi:t-SNARE complex subunit (syntaxin)
MLEEENQRFYSSLETEYEMAQKAERDVEEISTMISQFNTKISEQHESITKIQSDASISIDNSQKAEKELEKALSLESATRSMTVTFLLIATASLWFLHWYYD